MTTYALDLRDGAWEQAQAARECADWLASLTVQGKAPRTVTAYAYTVWDLLEQNPDVPFAQFTVQHVERLLARYPQAGMAPRRAHLHSFFKWGWRRDLIDRNPMDRLEPHRKTRSKVYDVFDDTELAALYGLPSPDGPMLTIMGDAALRRLECIQLQTKHISLANAELAVLNTKYGKSRVVPMTAKALAAATDLITLEGLNPKDYVWFSRPGGRSKVDHSKPVNVMTFYRWFYGCCEQAGVRQRTPHMMRHTRATRMRRLGYQLDEIQMFLGHESIETTSNLYIHTNVYDVAQRVADLEGALT